MFPANRSGARGKPLKRSKVQSRRSKAPAGWRPRPVRIHNGHPRLRLDRRAVIAAIQCLDFHAAEILGRLAPRRRSTLDSGLSATPAVPPGELSLAFLTDSALARLHATFLGDVSTTDVITFAGAPASGLAPTGSGLAGEICLSADAARAFAAKHGRDFSEELTLYLVHGWLHLAGHDDLRPANKKRMRTAEARALALLRAGRKIPRFAFAG
jgi:probable rRNA maturation factor